MTVLGRVFSTVAINSSATHNNTNHAPPKDDLTRLGKTPPFADGQIIAIAKTNDLILVTLNLDDYRAFDGAKVEDWSR